jgi:hypothetical protein
MCFAVGSLSPNNNRRPVSRLIHPPSALLPNHPRGWPSNVPFEGVSSYRPPIDFVHFTPPTRGIRHPSRRSTSRLFRPPIDFVHFSPPTQGIRHPSRRSTSLNSRLAPKTTRPSQGVSRQIRQSPSGSSRPAPKIAQPLPGVGCLDWRSASRTNHPASRSARQSNRSDERSKEAPTPKLDNDDIYSPDAVRELCW